jgi:glyoxylate reductase
MPKVLVTTPLAVPTSDLAGWLGGAGVSVPPAGTRLTGPDLLQAVADADALITTVADRVDAALLEAAPRLRVVANHAVGLDNVDVPACTRRGVAVANTPDVLTGATADLTMALLLAVARRLGEAEALLRSGRWTGWEPGQLLGADLAGQTLGIVGFGRIGQAVARRAAAFEMRVVHARPMPLAELLERADVVSLHCPLTAETRGMIGRAELARMKAGAILINTARGPLVDEEALAEALEAGHLGGAGLDVYAEEPRVHPRLLGAPRTVLLPHVGSATRRTRARMAELCARAVAAVLAGERAPNLVNPEVIR